MNWQTAVDHFGIRMLKPGTLDEARLQLRPHEELATVSTWGATWWVHLGLRDVSPQAYVAVARNSQELPVEVTKVPWEEGD